jgi:hypothetical protein
MHTQHYPRLFFHQNIKMQQTNSLAEIKQTLGADNMRLQDLTVNTCPYGSVQHFDQTKICSTGTY